MDDPNLFRNHSPGDYKYFDNGTVKTAYGQLTLAPERIRDGKAQRNVGEDERLTDDDGGHLIAALFGGAPDYRNLDAQNRNINRGAYRAQEKVWKKMLKEDCKVFVRVDTVKSNQMKRPDVYMAYAIYEYPDGRRDWDAFSITNASKSEQMEWNDTLEDEDFA